MTIDKKDFTRLSPEDRIKKLRQLEEERKKDVNEIAELIKKSMQEIKTDKLAGEIAPEQKSVDISKLFEAGGEQLEKTVNAERRLAQTGNPGYRAIAQVYQDYSSLKKMAGYAASGPLSQDQMEFINKVSERLDNVKYENTSTEVANLLVASRAALHRIKKYAGM